MERFGERDLPTIGAWRQLGKARRQNHRQVRPVIFYFFDQLQSGRVRHAAHASSALPRFIRLVPIPRAVGVGSDKTASGLPDTMALVGKSRGVIGRVALSSTEASMSADVFKGVMPALMTPCTRDRQPDFGALVRKGRELIATGMSAVIYCGSMGEWPLLSDEQRMEGVEHLVKAGLPVVVGTGAQNPRRAADLAAHAKKVGAKGLMLIPRVLSRGSSAAAQRAHFHEVLEAGVDLPSVIYNSPYYGFETRADLFFELRKRHPHLVGFKEFGGAAPLRYAAEHIAGDDASVMLLVGVDTQVFHGYVNCGAVGAITGIGNVLPKEVLLLVSLCQKAARGDAHARRQAQELDQALYVLSSFDEGVDLVLYYKYLMVLEGNPEYELQLYPSDALTKSQKHYAATQLKLFKSWYRNWLPLQG